MHMYACAEVYKSLDNNRIAYDDYVNTHLHVHTYKTSATSYKFIHSVANVLGTLNKLTFHDKVL